MTQTTRNNRKKSHTGNPSPGPRKKKRPSGKPKKAPAGRSGELAISWSGLSDPKDFSKSKVSRFYKMETLTNALERQIRQQDRFLLASITHVLGASPPTKLKFDLESESEYVFNFKVGVTNANRKRGVLRMAVAKNDREHSNHTLRDCEVLRLLHNCAPGKTIQVYKDGFIYLPDRYRRKEMGREVHAYVTEWLPEYFDLGVARTGQLCSMDAPHKSFSQKETNFIRRAVIELIALTYDPIDRTHVRILPLLEGGLAVHRVKDGNPKIKLVAAERFSRRVTPQKLIHGVLTAHWEARGARFSLVCPDPMEFVQALQRAVGKPTAEEWLMAYRRSVKQKRLPELPGLSLDFLDSLLTV